MEVVVLNCWVTETKDTPPGIKHLDHLGEVGEGSRQPVDLVDDDDIDQSRAHILHQGPEGRALHGAS
jgi:hypothetical protein